MYTFAPITVIIPKLKSFEFQDVTGGQISDFTLFPLRRLYKDQIWRQNLTKRTIMVHQSRESLNDYFKTHITVFLIVLGFDEIELIL